MEQGYLLEFGQGCFFQASWVRGPAKRPKGLSRPLADPGRSLAVAVGGLHPLAIDTYRWGFSDQWDFLRPGQRHTVSCVNQGW